MKKIMMRIVSLYLCGLLLMVVSCSDSDEAATEEEIGTELNSDIVGFYVGNVRADVGEMLVSIVVRQAGAGIFSGEYYGTGDFTPCCNDDNREDGTFRFTLDEDAILQMEILTNFEFSQCTGSFEGDGSIAMMNDRNILELTLIQNDCFFQNLETFWTLTKVRNSED